LPPRPRTSSQLGRNQAGAVDMKRGHALRKSGPNVAGATAAGVRASAVRKHLSRAPASAAGQAPRRPKPASPAPAGPLPGSDAGPLPRQHRTPPHTPSVTPLLKIFSAQEGISMVPIGRWCHVWPGALMSPQRHATALKRQRSELAAFAGRGAGRPEAAASPRHTPEWTPQASNVSFCHKFIV
jgi:hypothetical protein